MYLEGASACQQLGEPRCLKGGSQLMSLRCWRSLHGEERENHIQRESFFELAGGFYGCDVKDAREEGAQG